MMKKYLAIALMASILVFALDRVAFGAELQDYGGEWKIDTVYFGGMIQIDAENTDAKGMKLAINGTSVLIEIPDTEKKEMEFKYKNGGLFCILDESDGYMELKLNDEDILHMKIKTDEEAINADFRRIGWYKEYISNDEDIETEKRDWTDHKKPVGAYKKLKVGENNDDVKDMEERLKELRWFDGEPDSVFDSDTEEAVKAFQTANGLKVTGIADGRTQRVIYADSAKKNGQ